MATFTIFNGDFSILTEKSSHADLVNRVKQIEKKNFPRHEALDFDTELKKRNTELLVVLDVDTLPDLGFLIQGYLVCNRVQKTAFLHKICVVKEHRRRGIARTMIVKLGLRLRCQGCTDIQLWVDEARVPARLMYQSLGFSEMSRVKGYYSPGRTGIKMKLDLQNDFL